MATDPLPPLCQAPTCEALGEARFLGLTPLCPRHAAKANGRAAGNVLVVGIALAAAGAVFAALDARSLAAALGGAGLLVAALAPWFRRRARHLGGASGSGGSSEVSKGSSSTCSDRGSAAGRGTSG